MPKVKLGRPKGKSLLNKEDILNTALMILDESGPKGLSMRALAKALHVTPMALYHHVSDRVTLLRDLSDMVYRDVSIEFAKASGPAIHRLEQLLLLYRKSVIRCPNLSLSIFDEPSAFSEETARITKSILSLLKEANLSLSKRRSWLNILVDFTHGNSIALAMNIASKGDASLLEWSYNQYLKDLRILLHCLFESG